MRLPGQFLGHLTRTFALAIAIAVAGRTSTARGLIELSAATGGAVAWAPGGVPKIAFVSPVAAVGFDVGWHLIGFSIGMDSAPLIKGEVTCLYDTFDDPRLYNIYDSPCTYGRGGPNFGGPGHNHDFQVFAGPMFGARRVRAGPFLALGPRWMELGLRSTVVLKTTNRRSFSVEIRTAQLFASGTEAMLLARWSWNFAPERDTSKFPLNGTPSG